MTSLHNDLVSVKDLTFHYEEDESPVLQNTTFSISNGDTILLLGPSGAGKSTLTFCINGLYPSAVDGQLSGTISIHEKLVTQYQSGEVSQIVGAMFQDPDSQFCMLTVEDEIAFGLENIDTPPHEMEAKIDEVLNLVHLTDYKYQSIQALSGGQKQKLALACVLAMKPDLLILDEPTANLDPKATIELVTLIQKLQQKHGFSLLVIEHKLDDWMGFVNRCLVLDKQGSVLFDGDPRTCFTTYSDSLRSEGIWLPKTCEVAKLLQTRGLYHHSSMPLHMNELCEGVIHTKQAIDALNMEKPERSSTNVILKVNDLHFNRKEKQILRDVDVTLYEKEIVALVGENGTGKTTFSKLISGLLSPSSGEVLVEGTSIEKWGELELRKKMGYVFQNPEHQFITDSVYDEVAFGLRMQGLSESDITHAVTTILQQVGLLHVQHQNPFSLSQGQKRRLSVATMLIDEQKLLILDEPTFGQDANTATALMNLFTERVKGGASILMITHDMNIVNQYANSVIVLHEGTVAFTGTPKELWQQSELLKKAHLQLPFYEAFQRQLIVKKEDDYAVRSY
ncbi:ABC transporter ATP-binding protein [Metabacillus iocasae]|uniref:Energy-coupling factor transport system ATP-binding protein n=1 Tax=Priestia iocasae TaxID=2291674 RepID=A0ABS2QTX8_9BACI|nr:ABC transporter ATP-binding protein [Metabacillus iocasae]MBM7702457.1 energy-coupling factor transport system ATP-binding protein [Metabacillus iocasae]